MSPTLEDDLANYLRNEAARVEVTSTLDVIEDDLVYVPRVKHRERVHRFAPLLAAASIAALMGGLVVVSQQTQAPASSSSNTVAAGSILPEAEPAPTGSPTATTTPAVADDPPSAEQTDVEPQVIKSTQVSLPGGAVLNGVVPTCSATTDEEVFECTIESFPEPLDGLDYNGYVAALVDDSSRVSGGCRATNPAATVYLCYIGQRAIDEQVIGEDLLGAPASREYATG